VRTQKQSRAIRACIKYFFQSPSAYDAKTMSEPTCITVI